MEINDFKNLAASRRNNLFLLFIGSGLISMVSYSIRDWSEVLYGWQSSVVSGIFTIIGGIAILVFFMFGVLLYSWFKDYKYALRDASMYDYETVRKMWNDVLGPIPWK